LARLLGRPHRLLRRLLCTSSWRRQAAFAAVDLCLLNEVLHCRFLAGS
jgi:hypothetical protein